MKIYFHVLESFRSCFFCSLFTIQQYCFILFYFPFRHSLKFCHLCCNWLFLRIIFSITFFYYYYYLIQPIVRLFVTLYYFLNYSIVVRFIFIPVPCCVYDLTKTIVSIPHPFHDSLNNFYHYLVVMQIGFPKNKNYMK